MGHEIPNNPPEGMGNMEDPFEDLENFKPAERDPQLEKLGREMFEAAEHEEYQKATRICQKLIQLENKLDPSQVKKHKKQEETFLERAEEMFSVNGESESSHLRKDGCESELGGKHPCGREKFDPIACVGCEKNTSISPKNIGNNMPKTRLPK